MLDLTSTTFIIPIRIDHQDRYNNAKTVLNYLNRHLKTNVFIYEVSDSGLSKLDFLSDLTNLNIQIVNEHFNGIFHRTKYLNVLLNYVETPVVCNYDIDVVLKPETYLKAQTDILNGDSDVLFPYEFGNAQIQIHTQYSKLDFLRHVDLDKIPARWITENQGSQFGHCIFFNTDVYKKGGGENENFISWGPEDKERPIRFDSFGYSINWMPGVNVWHFEHERGIDSSSQNSYHDHNWQVFKNIVDMTSEQLLEYYKSQEYIKQYDNFLHPEQKQPKVS